jgi:hypothetical protein
MSLDRRKFLQALGIGGAALSLPGVLGPASRASAQVAAPRRVLFFVTPHGTVWNSWSMAVPGLGAGTSSAPIAALPDGNWSRILAPLRAHRAKLTIVEGLARTGALEYERAHDSAGAAYDLNRHHFGRAELMTCVDPLQRAGTTCIGGGRSIDQVIGEATGGSGRWSSRVYGSSHGHPYSFVAPGEESARVETPRQAFDDLVGRSLPTASASTPTAPADTRAAAIRRARGSILDFAAREHAAVAARLGALDREKLERHAQLIRDLETSFAGIPEGSPEHTLSCDPSWSELGHAMDQFARVTTLALACDTTRVATIVTPDLGPGEIGLPSATDIHQDYAHSSIRESASAFTLEAERGMVEYNLFYANRFAYLLDQLDSVSEGDGTLLDHTAVVWISELGTGTHDLHDLPVVIAGGAGGALRTGQYVRYARDTRIRAGWGFEVDVGPSHARLYGTLMRAMGMSTDRFGLGSVTASDGRTVSLTGALPELLA